ncbi:heme anaerobic degradation radical SAM methyltransferase ChuW/HutW [Orbaceae bacterium ESL0727]|nr:heme anaerobic degradation radical SAM methyltransferase ChuW/HutW [Orbaceae bacterium ESL0727]
MTLNLSAFFAQDSELPFPDRRAVMPWRNTAPISPDDVQATWRSITQSVTPHRKRLFYIHIPFCATHCTFCGFYQNKLQSDSTARYHHYLTKEFELEAESQLLQSAPIHAIYFGGGTPTAMSAQELYAIISLLKKRLPLAPDCEITIEGRILDFTDEKIDACLAAGANRFSIGIQTFNSAIRKKLARTTDGDGAIRFLDDLAARDQAAVVCDLIFGLPDQTEQTWRDDLAIVSQLPIDGVDLYAMNLLPTTPLFKSVEAKRIELPDVTMRRRLHHLGAEHLTDMGWQRLSNSHWARTTRERNLYNLLIKQGADCLALGSGAGGNIQGHSYLMERNLDNYYHALDEGRKPIAMMTAPSKAVINGQNPNNDGGPTPNWQHKLQAGIEVGRIDLTQLSVNAKQLQPLLQQWSERGLCRDDSLCIRLTEDGRFWSSNLMQALQQLIPQLN